MNPKLYAALGAFLVGFGSLLGSLDSWSKATSPLFIAGVVGLLGSVVLAAFADKPGRDQ